MVQNMESDWNLSVKLRKDGRYQNSILKIEDVREFVKRLKDLGLDCENHQCGATYSFHEQLDELAGEKLI